MYLMIVFFLMRRRPRRSTLKATLFPYPTRFRSWPEPRQAGAASRRQMQTHPLLGTRIASPIAASLYEATVGTGVMPFLADHVVFGDVVAPGAMHAVLGLCMAEMRGSPAPAVADLVFAAALTVPDEIGRAHV